jgi:hypothetical protein
MGRDKRQRGDKLDLGKLGGKNYEARPNFNEGMLKEGT